MEHEIDVSLVITGFGEPPGEISRRVGIQPTQTWEKGDHIGDTAARRNSNGWKVASHAPKHATFDEHIRAVLDVVRHHEEDISKVCSRYQGQLSCAIYLSHGSEKSLPVVHLDRPTLEILRQLQVEVDFDLYIVP